MGRIDFRDRKEVVRIRNHLATSLEQRSNFEAAVVAWGDDFPTMAILQRKKRRCMVCAESISKSDWPKGLHYCECEKWHAVCPRCVRYYSMVNRPFSGSWDYQKLDLCVRPIRTARKFM